MTLYEFNGLSFGEKYRTIIETGTFLDNHISQLERCNLYAIGMFFVEVVYDPIQNRVSDVRSFTTGHLMDKYTNFN